MLFQLKVFAILQCLSPIVSWQFVLLQSSISCCPWNPCISISAVYTRHFPFISPLAAEPASRFAFFIVSIRLLSRSGQPLYPSRYVCLAACSCGCTTLHPVDCIPFGLPRTNASFDSRDSKKELGYSNRGVPRGNLLGTFVGNI